MTVLGTVTVLEVLEGPLFQQLPPAFFLLAKKSGRDESWVVYFWRETLPLATSLTFSPEGKTLPPTFSITACVNFKLKVVLNSISAFAFPRGR
jgi:hypothetical protein